MAIYHVFLGGMGLVPVVVKAAGIEFDELGVTFYSDERYTDVVAYFPALLYFVRMPEEVLDFVKGHFEVGSKFVGDTNPIDSEYASF